MSNNFCRKTIKQQTKGYLRLKFCVKRIFSLILPQNNELFFKNKQLDHRSITTFSMSAARYILIVTFVYIAKINCLLVYLPNWSNHLLTASNFTPQINPMKLSNFSKLSPPYSYCAIYYISYTTIQLSSQHYLILTM
jgi:hypothetical protein